MEALVLVPDCILPCRPPSTPEGWFLYGFGLFFPSLVRNFTLNLHLQRKPSADVNFFMKTQLYLLKRLPYFQ